MGKQLEPLRTIHSLLVRDGSVSESWKLVRSYLAEKQCVSCGVIFRPKVSPSGGVIAEVVWKKRRFCSVSCAKKVENCMHLPDIAEKVSKTLRARGWKPLQQVGNGKPLPLAQATLAEVLGWDTEVAVKTGMRRGEGYP